MQKQDDPNSHGWWRVGKLAIGSSSLHFSVVQFDKMLFSVYVIRSASWRFAVWCISSYGNHAGSLPCPGGCKLFGYLCCTIAALSHSLPPPPTFFFRYQHLINLSSYLILHCTLWFPGELHSEDPQHQATLDVCTWQSCAGSSSDGYHHLVSRCALC